MAGIEIGIMAHNEAGNLSALLGRLMDEPVEARICIVSSGSTDGTDHIAEAWAETHPEVRTIIEPQRRGKARAINRFLASIPTETHAVVLISGDVIPNPGTLGRLLAPLQLPLTIELPAQHLVVSGPKEAHSMDKRIGIQREY